MVHAFSVCAASSTSIRVLRWPSGRINDVLDIRQLHRHAEHLDLLVGQRVEPAAVGIVPGGHAIELRVH